jgi:serpin B
MKAVRASATFDGKFTTLKGETTVRIMSQVMDFRYAEVRGARLVELPYKGELSMIVVLPDDVDGLEKIEDRLGGSYADWIGVLEYKRVDLELPRFTATTDLPLVGLLKALGIQRAFYPGADFSGMTAEASLFIGDAIQKAWIETNEQGTEAAAVTEVEMRVEVISDVGELPPPPPVIFHANHPFLYLIRDVKSGEILFVGRMVKPAE